MCQKYNNSKKKWVQTHLNLPWFVNYIMEERQLFFAFFSLWCLFVLLVPKGGGVGEWCSAGKRFKLTICHFEHWALKGQNLSKCHEMRQTNLCSFISYFPFPLALQLLRFWTYVKLLLINMLIQLCKGFYQGGIINRGDNICTCIRGGLWHE